MIDKHYVVVKLISGETVMATFDSEDDKYIKVDYPVQIKTILIPGLNRESITASPYCPFSDSTTFVLEKSHVIYVKRLHREFIAHYENFIKSYDEARIPVKRDRSALEELEEAFDDMEELTLEEVNRRLDMLEAIANAPKREDDEEDEPLNYFPGNDTKH